MTVVRLDAHAHLYDEYQLDDWCRAAVTGLQGGDRSVLPALVVVDRVGQDSFSRFSRELSSERWSRICLDQAGIISVDGLPLIVIRGAQYVSSERIEVLGLGAERADLEELPARQIIDSIRSVGGVACLPWSPGKWLGGRGRVVREILRESSAQTLTFGDIAIRSAWGPPSSLLSSARRRGHKVFLGSDPLPAKGEERLVGSFGVELAIRPEGSVIELAQQILQWLKDPSALPLTRCGRRNGPVQAFRRLFFSTPNPVPVESSSARCRRLGSNQSS